MGLSSLELAARCHQRGLLSKEAMDDVLRVRNKLFKEAMAKEAAKLFPAGARVAGRAAKAAEKSGGFFDNLKRGFGFGNTTLPKSPADWGSAAGSIGRMLALGGALAAGTAGVHGIMRHSRDKQVRNEIENSYKQMFVETPGLENLEADKVRRNFGVLARYAPSIAAEPVVAGAWVKGTVQMGFIDADVVNKLSATQSIIDRHHEGRALFQPGAFTAGVNLARQATGGGGRDTHGDDGKA
jgi:hypothetical protein